MMCQRVIVLGAGVSSSYRESPTGLRPPLAKEIIPTYYRSDISTNRYVLVGDIINYVRDTRGISPVEFASWSEDLESFFSEVDEEISRSAKHAQSGKRQESEEFIKSSLLTRVYNQLIFLLATVFNEIQNGPVSTPYMLLASELKTDDVVITFNWDTLLDRALYTSGIWSPSNGYCIKPESIFDDQWRNPETFHHNKKKFLYIKLHGSTNWLSPYHGVNLTTGEKYSISKYSMDKLFVYIKSTKPYDTYEDRYWGSYEPFSYCYYPPNLPTLRDDTKPGYANIRILSAIDLPKHANYVINDKNVYSMPLIVPPVRNKQYMRYGNIFSTLWGLAERSMSECRQLYVIGYSFPETDIATKQMFKDALAKNRFLEKVVIINPHPQKIAELCINEFDIMPSRLEVREKKFEVPYSYKGQLL